jgi:hypothetical protein
MVDCTVRPENYTMLLVFGWFMMACGGISLLTGATYFRRVIRKIEEPRSYWVGTASFLMLGGYILFMLMACRSL